ncbi:MAG TPA: DUF58 domain-containing protein [Acidimicrobiales bacterium]|nr:DUF58 domain-containing protein [Acidimicrobiales bacterium]
MIRRLQELDAELRVLALFVVLAGVGWWLRSTPLAIIGSLAAVTTLALYVWQRDCLSGVSYRRVVGRERATFGEEVTLGIEIVNDKLLPLSWLHVEDEIPAALEIRGGTVVADDRALVSRLVDVLPLLPYQRVRRQLTISCSHRGDYLFGPARLSSGDPIGFRTRTGRIAGQHHLLVYPKVFALAPDGIASRMLIGDERTRTRLLEDPSRISGVREYRAGDALRSIDWRATARSTGLLVRQFEPTVSQRVALFLDLQVSGRGAFYFEPPALEFTIAVAASVLTELERRGVATGLFSSGTIAGRPLACPPSSSPAQLALMLESLARVTHFGSLEFAHLLAAESSRLRPGTSVVIVSADYPAETLEALGDLRRRHALSALWVANDHGAPPPREHVDALLTARYADDWQRRESLELAA